MPGGAGDIYETYGQFPRLAIGGGAGDIYGTVGPMIQPQMGGAMDIYGRYGTAVSGYQPYGNYGMHGGYGYGTTDENIYGEGKAIRKRGYNQDLFCPWPHLNLEL